MTFVDDSLAGAVPVRGGKSGAKGMKQAEIAAQKDAFNQAFSEAGKKQQPQVSIREKAGADATETQSRISIKNAAIRNADAEKTSAVKAGADQDTTSTIKQAAGDDTKVAADEMLADVNATPEKIALTDGSQDPWALLQDQEIDAKDGLQPKTGDKVKPDFTKARAEADDKNIDAKTGQIDLLEDTGTTETLAVDADLARKLADIFKERQSQVSKAAANDKGASAKDAADSKGADVATTATTDVDQLLAMLGGTQTQVVPAEDAPQASPALSEFQALAERAGKTKVAAKETDAALKAGQARHETAHGAEASTAGSTADTETDQLFRFARADGKGQDVSMAISADGDKTTIDASGTAAARGETITVVEARRYLGLAPSSNAQAVTTAIAGDAEWAQSIQQTSAATDPLHEQATGKVVNTLKIQMHPIDLGLVTATLRLKDDELHVDLKVETGDAFRQLSDDQNAMVKALRAQGFAVDQVNVVFNAPDSNSSNTGQQQQQQFQSGGQGGREASAGDGAAQGRQQRNDGGQQSEGNRWTANDTTGDLSSADAGRSGNVYI